MRKYLAVCLLLVSIPFFAEAAAGSKSNRKQNQYLVRPLSVTEANDSIYFEIDYLQAMGRKTTGSLAMQRLAVPYVIALPHQQSLIRRKLDPSEFAGIMIVNAVQLEEQDEELLMEVEIKIDREIANQRQSWTVIPELWAADSSLTFAGVLVNGRIKAKHFRRRMKFEDQKLLANFPRMKVDITAYTDTLMRYSIRLPYDFWMDEGILRFHHVLTSSAGKQQLLTVENTGRVAIRPREPYQVSPLVNYLQPAPEQKQRKMQGQAFLDFQVGRSVILPDFRRNPQELAKIREAITKVKSDPDVQIVGLFIEGYASPEGSYSSNTKLAQDRAQALSDYIVANYGIPANIMRTSSVPEDWEGLRILVQESNIARRDEILAIIDGSDEPDRKEQRLRAMGAPWRTMLNDMFPTLRRVEYQIDFTVKDYTVEESRDLANRNPEMLSQRELFLLAQSYAEDSPERERIYEIIIRQYPDDNTALINHATRLLERGEITAAKRYLDRAGDDARVYNSLGVYWLKEGDLDRAEENFRKAALGSVAEAEHNLNEVKTKREDNALMERYKNRK